ncbi:MAG: DNA topoisomerase IB, partial [Acidimicrobiales bacterium]
DPPEPAEAAAAAGLRYASDAEPGLTRRRAGKGFSYRRPDGSAETDRAARARIAALAVPPAWRDVWISADPRAHLQATGWDARGRKQYRYHPRWREVRDLAKFERLAEFGGALPDLRRRVRVDLARRGLPQEKVVAAVVQLLDDTLIRVGNEEYAQANASYGLTTLRDEHVRVAGARLSFEFRAKGGLTRRLTVTDRRLAGIVQRCQDLPGQVLFGYLDDDGVVRNVGSRDVNDYLHEATSGPFTAKDFRTWAASVIVAGRLAGADPPASETERKATVAAALRLAADRLANTPAVCRASYVQPAVLDAFPDRLAELTPRRLNRVLAGPAGEALTADEARLLALLEPS